MTKSLLLASFVPKDELYGAIEQITKAIQIDKSAIFVFLNESDPDECILSYNVNPAYANIKFTTIWRNTISIHRKKQTNTLYSLNAMNEYIKSKCNGHLDKTYNVDWNIFENKFLIIKGGKLKVIPIRLIKLNQ